MKLEFSVRATTRTGYMMTSPKISTWRANRRERRSRVTFQFFATPANIRQQLLRDFDQFARRMRLMYIFRGENNEPHPYHVKSAWEPPIQRSVALESYLEEVKSDLAEIEIRKPKNNLPPAEREVLRALKRDTEINLKKADKGTILGLHVTSPKIKLRNY